MKRRAFLTGLATALAAPAIVKAESLMKIYVPRRRLVFGWDIAFGPDQTLFDLGQLHKVGGVWEWREVSLGYSIIRNDLATPIPTRLLVAKRAIDEVKRQLGDGKPLTSMAHPLAT